MQYPPNTYTVQFASGTWACMTTNPNMKTVHSKAFEALHTAALGYGNTPLFTVPSGQVFNLVDSSLLVNFTFEDKAAKGLRKRTASDVQEPHIYFSAVEVVRDEKMVMLSGGSGSGKTVFGKYLAYRMASNVGEIGCSRPTPRNDAGYVYQEKWDATGMVPWYFGIESASSLDTAVRHTIPELLDALGATSPTNETSALVILDVSEEVKYEEVKSLLYSLIGLIQALENTKLLILGDTRSCEHWVLPSCIARHSILPLLKVQRQQAVAQLTGGLGDSQGLVGYGPAAATPAIFALALESGDPGNCSEEVLDAWLLKKMTCGEAEWLAKRAFYRLKGRSLRLCDGNSASIPAVQQEEFPLLFQSRVVQGLLAALFLSQLPLETAVELFQSSPETWEPVLLSLQTRLGDSAKSRLLVDRLLQESNPQLQRGAQLVFGFRLTKSLEIQEFLRKQMLQIVEHGALTRMERRAAGRKLSELGDPRDLEALAVVDGGTFTMGSEDHANSQPLSTARVQSFRIGIYPVVNRDYLKFVQHSGRHWHSMDGRSPNKQNFPATDLSWHDARAYCAWLTSRWREMGKISSDEIVRLPTEIEWERASRGDLQTSTTGNALYPWGQEWCEDRANFEETGFNEPCTVGLFPKGRSPCGVYDMAGNVWEWCSTLWGEDMTTPSFSYPYRSDDGRESSDAPESTRRVLRGGCFSSARFKVSCSYRGSLEPAGYWRGNGFRVVVASSVD